jgi:hypothetical protein
MYLACLPYLRPSSKFCTKIQFALTHNTLRLHGNNQLVKCCLGKYSVFIVIDMGNTWAGIAYDVIASRYGLDGPVTETVGGEILRTRRDRPWCPLSLLYNAYGSFLSVKRPERGINHPPPSSAGFEESVELYLYSLSGISCQVIG